MAWMGNAALKLPKEIWALGLVSLLMDVSSETVHGLLPVFLVSALGTSFTTVGVIEGLGEAIALLTKVVSGPLSDRLGRRKPLVILGYAMGALSKPIFAIAPTAGVILFARLFDRTGKGIRGAPRDALIADLAPRELWGRAFGLRQSLDTVGAFIGPILAILLMQATGNDYRFVFWLAAIPGLFAVALVFWGVREPEAHSTTSRQFDFSVLRRFGGAFWFVAIAGGVFQLARFSEAFLILRAKDLGLAIRFAPLVLISMNIVYALAAYPIGWLSDHLPRVWFVIVGFITLIVADIVLAYGADLRAAFLGIVLWGLHLGLSQGVLAAMVVDTCPKEWRATAFGVFNVLSAVALLIANPLAGILWDRAGGQTTFLIAAALAVLGALGLLLSYRNWRG